MRRALRIALRAAGFTLNAALVAAVVAIALLLAVSRGFERERLRAFVERTLERALADAFTDPPQVSVGALEGALYPDLVLRDVRIARGGETPVRLDVVRVQLDLRSLADDRRVAIESLRIEGAEVSLGRDATGRFGLHGLETAPPGPKADEPAFAWPDLSVSLELHELVLDTCRIRLDFAQGDVVTQLTARADGSIHSLVWPKGAAPHWPADAAITLAVGPGQVSGRALEQANLTLRLADSYLWLDPSSLQSAFGRAELRGETDLAGWLDPTRPAFAKLDARFRQLDPGIPLERPRLRGDLTGHLALEAWLPPGAALAATVASGRLVLERSELGPLRVASAEVSGRLEQGHWELATAKLDANAARVRMTGHGGPDRIDELVAEIDATDLAVLAETAVALGAPDLGLAGAARLRASVQGPPASPTGRATLTATRLSVARVPLGALRADARLEPGGRVRVAPLTLDGPSLVASADGPVELAWVDGGVAIERLRLRARGLESAVVRGRIEAGAVRDLRVSVHGLDLTAPPPLLRDALDPGLGGTLSAEIVANGALPTPTLTGSAEWREPRWRDARLNGLDVLTATLEARSPEAILRARVSKAGRELVTLELRTPWDASFAAGAIFARDGTRLLVRGSDLDASVVRALWPEAPTGLDGYADATLELRGGPSGPRVTGELRVRDAFFDVPAIGQRFGPLTGRAVLADDALQLEDVRLASVDGGAAVLGGRLALDGLAPVGADLRLDVHAFELRREPDFSGRLDGAILLDGPLDALAAHGKLVLSQAHVKLTQQRNPLFKEIRVQQLASAPAGSIREEIPAIPPLLDGASIDVRLEIADDARLEGQGANVELEGRLDARKRPFEEARVLGQVESTRGSYRLYGKVFTIDRGRVVFTGRRVLDPDLDVAATHRVRDVNVRAVVSGTVSKPVLHLESDPPYPENDLLALLLFGRTTEELAQSQAGAFSVFVAQTAGAAALDTLGSAVGPALPIENFTVSATDSGDGASVGLGHYVTQDVYVQYDQDVTGAGGSRVRLDWKLTRRWSIETRVSTDGGSSADLIWTYDY